MIRLNPRAKAPLYEQIYLQIRDGIANGTYPPKSKLASIRELAEQLHCSRNTVEAAYRMLLQEGFVYSKPGSGVIVEEHLPSGFRPVDVDSAEDAAAISESSAILYDFTYGNLENGTFPALLWKSITDDVLLSVDSAQANCYTDSAGEMELRREIARMVLAQRGVHCEPEQVIVQAGTQASLQNLLLLFDPQTDIIGMEEPGYDGVRSVFERSRFQLYSCPVDPNPNGKFVQACREGAPKLVYTTPSNQFPTGKVMPLEMRKTIIEWADEADAYLLEDDYCCEFLYSESPLPSLKSLDRHGRVIYMGTFSKSLSPALRINYLILPPAILERWQHVFSNA
ncbi:MAG: PLP-dependent aminotransferase family protein, partial [Eggerthellaceae bacterium]|nr:PLP-dependent aminotransferase family protein [Eggerthellaceae bacterium]